MTTIEERLVVKGITVGYRGYDTLGIFDPYHKISKIKELANLKAVEYDYVIVDLEEREYIPSDSNGCFGGTIEGGWGEWETISTEYEIQLSSWDK